MLVDLNSSLGLILKDLERSLLDELCLDLERLIDGLEDLLDLDLPLGGSLPPELDFWRSALAGDLETEEGIVICGSLITESIQKGV